MRKACRLYGAAENGDRRASRWRPVTAGRGGSRPPRASMTGASSTDERRIDELTPERIVLARRPSSPAQFWRKRSERSQRGQDDQRDPTYERERLSTWRRTRPGT